MKYEVSLGKIDYNRSGMKYEVSLGKIDYNRSGRRNCEVTLEIEITTKRADIAPYLDIDLQPLPESGVTELSICGNIWNPRHTDIYSGGQNIDTIREYFQHRKDVMRLCEIWDRYHLNGMQAGTRQQRDKLKEMTSFKVGDYYTDACGFLKNYDLYEVPIPEGSRKNFAYQSNKDGELPTHYKYGSAWLFEHVPDEIIAELQQIIERQNYSIAKAT